MNCALLQKFRVYTVGFEDPIARFSSPEFSRGYFDVWSAGALAREILLDTNGSWCHESLKTSSKEATSCLGGNRSPSLKDTASKDKKINVIYPSGSDWKQQQKLVKKHLKWHIGFLRANVLGAVDGMDRRQRKLGLLRPRQFGHKYRYSNRDSDSDSEDDDGI